MSKVLKKILILITIFSLLLINNSFSKLFANSILISTVQTAYPNQNITVNIIASRNNDYNAIELSINFTNLIFVSSTVASGWTPVQGPTQNGNTITFAGALLGSSVNGNRSVLTINFKTQNVGNANITVNGVIDGTGLGTGSSNISNSTNIQVISRPTPTNTTTPTPTRVITQTLPKELNIISETHPDQNRWYNLKQVKLTWNKEENVTGFSYTLDQNININPDDIVDITSNILEANLSDGIYYFRIKAKNSTGWGPISSYQIKIDSEAPESFTPEITKDNSNNLVLKYYTKDNLSQTIIYKIYINDNLFVETKENQVTIPNTTNINQIKIEAIDEAGNIYTYTRQLQEDINKNTENGNNKELANNEINLSNQSQNNNKSENIDIIKLISIALNIILIIYAVIMTNIYLKFRKLVTKQDQK